MAVEQNLQRYLGDDQLMSTPWKFNIAPENIPSQKESGLPTINFQGRAVKLREGIHYDDFPET